MRPGDFFHAYCEYYIGSNSRMPIVRLKPRGSVQRCPLLKDRKCSVHKAKPVVCAMFPIGRGIRTEGDVEKIRFPSVKSNTSSMILDAAIILKLTPFVNG